MYPYTCNLYGGDCCNCGDCRKKKDNYWEDYFAEHEIDEAFWRDKYGKNTLEEDRF